MRTRLKSFLLLAFLGFCSLSYSQTATWTKNFANEGEVRTGTTNEIVVTLTGAETFADTLDSNDAAASTFIAGMTGYSSEWGAILSGITASDITLSGGDKVATIDISQSVDYYITADDVIGFTIPADSHSGASAITCSSDLTITNLQTTVSPGGDLDGGVNETAIRGGENTLTLTLTNNKWVSDIASSEDRLDTIQDMFSGASKFGTMVAALGTDDITVNTARTVLTITFPVNSNYYLTTNEDIDVEARQHLLEYSEAYSDSTHAFTISNVAPAVTYGGDLHTGINESDMRTSEQTYTLTLTDNLWITGIESENAERDLVRGMFSNSTKFAPLASALAFGDLDVSGDQKTLTITFPAKTDYIIGDHDEVTVTPHQDLLVYPEAYSVASTTFTISNEDPIISITNESFTESDVQDGSSFEITLNGDIWDNPLSGDFKDRVSAGGASVWDGSVQSNLTITRTSDFIVTVSWASTSYEISSTETVTITSVLVADLVNTTSYISPISISGAKTINPNAATIVANLVETNVDEGDIRTGTHTITLDLDEDTWVAGVGSDGADDVNLLNSITCSPASTDWDDLIDLADVSTPVGNVVTVSIPTDADFDIVADISLSFSPPTSLFTGGSTVSDPGFDDISRIAPYIHISPVSYTESEVWDEPYIVVDLFEDTFKDLTFNISNFTLNQTPDPGSDHRYLINLGGGGDDILETSNTQISLKLKVDNNGSDQFNITENYELGLSIDGVELDGGEAVSNTNADIWVYAVNNPVILDVDIPDFPMGIDTVVKAVLTVADDDGITFTYKSGTIAGRSIESLTRENSTTYFAYFTITEGSQGLLASESIIIDSLQLFNDPVDGSFFSDTIIQGNDPIDTRRPVVDLIDIDDGDYKVGDVITALVHADEAGLSFDMDLTTFNTLKLGESSNVNFNEIGSGIYELIYTVENGNPNVDPGPIPVDVVMKDLVNLSNTYSTVAGVTTIDATQPGIVSATLISSGAQTPDSVINISILSTEVGLMLGAGSHVNNVSDQGTLPSQINLTYVSGFTYNLAYTVGPDDDEILSPGKPASTIILFDGNGNEISLTNGLIGNDITIITEAPTASIYGGGSICPGESMELYVNLVGDAPFSLKISDGTDELAYTNITENPFSFFVTPSISDDYIYTVSEVKDKYGVLGAASGTADVTLNIAAEATIAADRTSFQVTDPPYELEANYPRAGLGTFSGLGVVSTESKFYPTVAGITDSTLVFYDFEETATGCSTRDTVEFSVVKEQAELKVPDYICYDSNDTIVEGKNLSGTAGYLRLYEVIGRIEIEKPLAIDSLPPSGNISKARILAEELRSGIYKVYYFYKYGVDAKYSSISKTFVLDHIKEVEFLKPADHSILIGGNYNVCNNEGVKELKTNLDERAGGTFEFLKTAGNGVDQDDDTNLWQFKPSQADVGYFKIEYVYTSDPGCTREADFYVTNNKVPELGFETNTLCISAEGGPIQFFDTTDIGDNTNPKIVSKWNWNYGDGDATVNDNNYESFSQENPIHEYSSWGKKIVTLTTEGPAPGKCIATIEKEIDLAVTPVTNFGWNSDCYLNDVDVEFDNKTEYGADVESYLWRISEEGGTIVFDDTTEIREDILKYPFPIMQNYNIRLISVTDIGCADTITRLLKLKETVSLKDADYYESFNQSDGRWSSDKEEVNGNNTWTHAETTFEGFTPAPGDLAWFTNLTPADEKDKEVDYSERSWMQSPCFDFRDTDRPMIRMDIMKSFDEYSDGAVLQYTTDDGKTWTTVGSRDQGISWYNYSDIFETPGGKASSIGWSGDEISEIDTVWETAAIDLDELIGEETVIFGIFYATNGSSRARNDGFAFDNIYVGERSKRALIEHFTNSASLFAENADAEIDDFTSNNELDVTSLQYHMHYPDMDPMNEINSSPGSSRSFYYGVSSLPYALMDGGTMPSYIYDDIENTPPTAIQLKELTLEDPLFELDVTFQLYDARLSTNVDIKALKNLDSMDLVLNVAVVEKTVSRYTGTNGDTEFKNVVLSMLPDAAGLIYTKSWTKNESTDKRYSWTYMGDVDTSEVMIVAFLQDRQTDKVLQVASEDRPEFAVSIPKYSLKSIDLYPNPARNELYVVFSEPISADGMIEVTDMTGRTVMLSDIYEQDQKVRLDIGELKEGSYILRTKENGSVTRRTNFIKVR